MLNSLKYLCVAILLIVINSQGILAQQKEQELKEKPLTNIAIKVLLQNLYTSSPKEYYLKIELTNNSEKQIKINNTLLPWGNGGFLEIVGVRMDNGKELEQGYPFPCLGVAETSIEPHETISGNVEFDFYSENFDEVLNETDIKIKWKYQLIRLGSIDSPSKIFSDEIIIPKYYQQAQQGK